MYKKMKAIVTVLLAAFCTMLITGCKNSDSPKNVVTVKFSYPPFGYDSKKEDAFWKKYIAEFEKQNPGIKIEQTVESWDNDGVFIKWHAALASGETPDIGYASPSNVIGYALKGKIAPVTDLVNELGGDKAFSPAMKYFKTGGEWYAVPNCDAAVVLAYRKDLLKAAGFNNPPKTWEELVKVAKATTKKGVYGLGMFTGDNILTDQIMCLLMVSAGGKMLDSNGKVALNSPQNLKALKFMSDLVKVHKVVPPSANDWKYGDDVNVIGAGKIAMDFMWAGYGTLLESMFPKDYKNIGFTTIPVGPSGHSGSWSGAGGFFMFKDGKHLREAKAFIKFMSRPEISKEWCIISGNVSPFIKIAKDPELTKYEWYRATAEQSPTTVNQGWDYGIVLGMDIIRTSHFPAKGIVEVLGNKKTPEQALADMDKRVKEVLDKAKVQGAK